MQWHFKTEQHFYNWSVNLQHVILGLRVGTGHAGFAMCYFQSLDVPLPLCLSDPRRDRPSPPCCSPAGASIIWEKNFLMRDLAAAAGLEREQPSAGEGPGLFAVYDGR